MGETTAIEWATKTWEVTRGCHQVSPGCAHCWAKKVAEGRLRRFYPGGFGTVEPVPTKLMEPLKWRTPQRIFVSSRSDFFHETIPDWWRDMCFATMRAAPQHTFMLLTKRADRMAAYRPHYSDGTLAPWPLPNVWMGVSVEYQRWLYYRLGYLVDLPVTSLFLSCEPLLGPLDLNGPLRATGDGGRKRLLDWVIVGGESGPRARPMNLDWARDIIQQCRQARVPLFIKQDSGRLPGKQGRFIDAEWAMKEIP